MKNSLDSEPPSKSGGKKEVNKKRNEHTPHLIFLLENKKSKDKSANSLEKEVKVEIKKSTLNLSYLNYEKENYKDNISLTLTSTSREFESVSTSSINPIKAVAEFNYLQNTTEIGFPEKKQQSFYDLNQKYSFAQKEDDETETDLSAFQKKHESKDSFYSLYKPEGEETPENSEIYL